MKTFVGLQFEFMLIYEFQTKANTYEDIFKQNRTLMKTFVEPQLEIM